MKIVFSIITSLLNGTSRRSTHHNTTDEFVPKTVDVLCDCPTFSFFYAS
jgi:hypothetical protein